MRNQEQSQGTLAKHHDIIIDVNKDQIYTPLIKYRHKVLIVHSGCRLKYLVPTTVLSIPRAVYRPIYTSKDHGIITTTASHWSSIKLSSQLTSSSMHIAAPASTSTRHTASRRCSAARRSGER